MGPRAPYPAVQVLWGLPAPTPREYRELRAPDPLGSDPVGVAHPHTPGVSGATRPRTPRFTFGRPKVNRKTAKTHGFGFLFPIGLYQWGKFSATESGFGHLIYSGSINDASATALLKGYMFLGMLVETCFLITHHGSIHR